MRQAWKRGLGLVLILVLIWPCWSVQAADDAPAWAMPSQRALRLVGPAVSNNNHPVLETNLSCQRISYRLVGQAQNDGCFVVAAFGFMNLDNSTVLLTGSDYAMPLQPAVNSQLLVPWPGTVDMLALSPMLTGGVALGMYDNILADLGDTTDAIGQVVGKRVMAPPDQLLRDAAGQPLIVNPQTIAFSPGGSWLIVETVNGVFVRVNLDSLAAMPFAPAFGAVGNSIVGNAQVAVSRDGRYVAIENTVMGSFRVYDLSGCTSHTCPSGDYWTFINSQLGGFGQVSNLHFVGDNILAFDAINSAGNNTYEMAPADHIDSLLSYLGSGDSYTAGEGAFDYLSGTDTPINECHVSANSYPILLTTDIFAGGGHNVACSGAKIEDILPGVPDQYGGQVSDKIPLSRRSDQDVAQILASFMPGLLPQADFVSTYQPGVLTVSVGGNDIGFGDILQTCVAPHISLRSGANTCFSSYEDRLELKNLIDRTVPRWTALYEQLAHASPLSRIYAIGYPQIAKAGGDCALNVHLNAAELTFTEELINYLNDQVASAAAAAGVNYVDISQALVGHRLCEAASYDVAVNGLTAGSSRSRPFSSASYHPNALGQALIEQAIIKQTQRFKSSTSIPVKDDVSALLAAPVSGRTVNVIVPDDDLTDSGAQPGQTINIRAISDNLAVSRVYNLRLDGAGGTSLGDLKSDSFGNVSSNVRLPEDIAAGGHTVDLTGVNLAGKPVDVRRPIFVGTFEEAGVDAPASKPRTVANFVSPQSPQVLGAAAVLPNATPPLESDQALQHTGTAKTAKNVAVRTSVLARAGPWFIGVGVVILIQIYWPRRRFPLQ
ncbi:MAG TPA: SGNH/GDSL hydrolase family protein [Candidatus Saccharimonadales bacterium]|nr:SGNH/GDSL hydrolase family protein [Candidatus Saccharimonadales bacterium]